MGMGFRQKKHLVREMLVARDNEGIVRWATADRSAFRVLISLLFEPEKVNCYRAAEVLGKVAAVEARSNLENVRELLRRLFWTMNDESGNICWYAPEAIGEILFNVPDLCREFCPILASFLSEEPFERGTRLAIARIAEYNPDIFDGIKEKLSKSLESPDHEIRGASLLALALIDNPAAQEGAHLLTDDDHLVDIYEIESGTLLSLKISDLAEKISQNKNPRTGTGGGDQP
ncbi:MAG: hypothetical protein CVT49_04100 [candidate division Zixibacteria bacterium HGW-Zixibacteria-1]|nr:MAG: hypothetical protein CVT49_04100 [candidate division Zixibacteria bacterium HGW-Zixibacteria-1]